MRDNPGKGSRKRSRPKGEPSPIDFDVQVNPVDLVRRGLAIINNELNRLIKISEEEGLGGGEALSLEKYVGLACRVTKDVKEIRVMKDITKMSDDEITVAILEEATRLKLPPGLGTFIPPSKKKKLTADLASIAVESENGMSEEYED